MSSDTLLFFTSPNTDKTFENVSINVNPSFDIAIFYYKKIIDHNKITLKLKSLGFNPDIDLKVGLEKTINWKIKPMSRHSGDCTALLC